MRYQTKTTNVNLLTFLVLFIAFITACNNTGTGTKETIDSSEKKVPDTSIKAPFSYGDFSVVVLSADNLARLFQDNGTQKILLQFADNNTAGDDVHFTLVGYGATKANRRTSDHAELIPQPGSTPINIPGLKYLGNLELTRAQINILIGNTGNQPITTANAKDLIFTPRTALDRGHVVYQVNVQTAQKITADELTNPSPPADPCNPCDR